MPDMDWEEPLEDTRTVQEKLQLIEVDTFNQMCLQHREEHRFQLWWKALGGMMLRIGATNAFTSCKALRQCPQGETMFDWQWRLMRYMYPVRHIVVSERHLPMWYG